MTVDRDMGPFADRIARLEAENAWLRDELGLCERLEDLATLHAHGLKAGPARMLLRLMSGRAVSHQALSESAMIPGSRYDGFKLAQVYACHIRRLIGSDGLETLWGHGYRLTPEGRARSEALVGERRAA